MEDQFVYIIPILERIIGNRYLPAAERHAMFLRGGKSRSTLSQSAGAHGTLFKLEVDKLLACILHWLRLGGHCGSPAASTHPSIPADNQHDPVPLGAVNGAHNSNDIPGPSDAIHHNEVDDEKRQETSHEETNVSADPFLICVIRHSNSIS